MKRLHCAVIIAAMTVISAQADPITVGKVTAQGGNSGKSAGPAPAATSRPGGTIGVVGGSINPTPNCRPGTNVLYPPCVTVYVTPGCETSYTNYQVVSPSVTTVTSGSYDVAVPAPTANSPSVAPTTTATKITAIGIVDAEGYIHSPYSKAIFKVANVTNGQTVHDPVTGKPFRVQTAVQYD